MSALPIGPEDFPVGQRLSNTHAPLAGGEQATEPTTSNSSPMLPASARFNVPPAPTIRLTAPTKESSAQADAFLYLQAQILDDLEKVRIANENRLRQLTRSTQDADGQERGFGLDETHPDVARLAGIVDAIKTLEHGAELNLKRTLRQHPLGAWVKNTVGVGEKQGARLLAAIGDPYWNTLHDRPRTVSELWAYCGYKPGQRRARGQRSNWSSVAKSRAYLIAEACLKAKARSPYGPVYDARREATKDRLHETECVRCGPSGKPAQPGSPWSAKHQHVDALRIVAKQVLKDLWRAARDLRDLPADDATNAPTPIHEAGRSAGT